ncbi:ABC transporter substrate-binding protein [Rhizomonospora bruguierae]|uniref:ABC transporter substrate-binding protein n=1 Tax=Rhizomonospora bruguierae TaxID=1581705 RepID=UPI001BCB639B|nr:extracellular solute-binding protein [Micromonospora sp. NBRC 107566]
MNLWNSRARVKAMVALSAALALPLAACSGNSADTDTAQPLDSSKPVTLRIAWSGSQDRTDRTLKAIDLFKQKHPNVTVNYESTTSTNFWDKLTTQVAGGNAPDIIQMSGQTLKQYVTSGVLLNIEPYVDNGSIDLSDWEKPLLDAQTIDGVLYGIPPGVDAHAIIYNATKLRQLGIAPPTSNWTWDDYTRMVCEIHQKGGAKYWGSEDGAPQYELLQVFLAQRGKKMFQDGGGLGFADQDVKDLWAIWGDLQKQGCVVPPAVQQENGANPEGSPVVKDFGAMDWTTSSQFENFVSLTKDQLGLVTYPFANDGTPGQVWRAGMAWSITKNSKNAAWAAALINFMVNDPDAGSALGTSRGVPASPAIRKLVEGTADAAAKQTFDNLTLVQATESAQITPVFPAGFNDFNKAYQSAYYNYAFGRVGLDDAVKQFMTAATAAASE